MINLGDLNTISMASSLAYSQQNALDKGIGIAAATIVDVGTSLWNSLVPEATGWEVSTRSMLQSMGADGALTAYDNNRDTVELLSFVGGIFIPGTAALKLAKGVRAGLKGTNFLSPSRHTEDLAKFESLIAQGAQGTADYKKVRNSMILRGQANNLMDTAAVEIALIGGFNAHPYMEDYMSDLPSNFGISMAIGGGIGAGLSAIASRIELRAASSRVFEKAINEVQDFAKTFDVPFSDTSTTLTHLNMSAERLEKMTTLEGYSPLAKEIAKNTAQTMRIRMGELANKKLSTEITELPVAARNNIANRFTDIRFAGADSAQFFKPRNYGALTTPKLPLTPNPVFKDTELTVDGVQDKFISTSYYSPEVDGFVGSAITANSLTTAADVIANNTIKAASKRFSVQQFHDDFKGMLDLERTGDVELEYLAGINFYNKLSTQDLARAEIFEGDFPAINGWISAVRDRTNKLQQIIQNPETDAKALKTALDEFTTLNNAKVKLYSGDRMQLVRMEQVTELPTQALDPTNFVSPTLFSDVRKQIQSGEIQPLLKDNFYFRDYKVLARRFYDYAAEQQIAKGFPDPRTDWHTISPRAMETYAKAFARDNMNELMNYATEGADLYPETILFLGRWIGGHAQDKEHFRNAMASARTLRRGLPNNTPEADAITNILNSPLIQRQKEILRTHGDAQGNIYIKRGVKGEVSGDTSVSSYTFDESVARSFGTVGTYKVGIDDIVGYLYRDEAEWLIGSSTRDIVDKIPTSAGKLGEKIAPKVSSTPKYQSLDVQELYTKNLLSKGQSLYDSVKGGMPIEVAAIKHNVSREMAELAASNPNGLADFVSNNGFDKANAMLNRWNNVEQIPEALSPTRRILQVHAREEQIMGDSGALLDLQRETLRTEKILDSKFKQALNNSDDTLAAQRLGAKINQLDETYAEVNRLWIEQSVLASKSGLAAGLLKDVLNSGEYKVLRESTAQFNNSKGGNPLTQSADMVTSEMGYVGKLVTHLGDMRNKVANRIETAFLDPVARNFRNLYANDAARTEFAIFDNIRLSNPGYLQYDAAKRTFVTGTINKQTGILENARPVTDLTVKSDEVHATLIALQAAGREIYESQKVIARLNGKNPPSDTGFWVPYTNLRNKEYAYVLNLDNNTQKLLVANNSDDLQDLITQYQPQGNEVIRRRADISNERLALMQDDLQLVTKANVEMIKRGIGMAAPDLSPNRLTDIVEGIRDRISAQSSAIVEAASFDLIKKLDYMSAQNQRPLKESNATGFRRTLKQAQTKDTAADIKDILLGHNSSYRSELMQTVNRPVDTALQFGIEATSKAFNLARTTVGLLGKKTDVVDFDKYEQARIAAGVPDPFAVFNEAAKPRMLQMAKDAGYSTDPNRIIRAGNEIATVLALKFGEIAQPLVNMLSLPILSTSTITRAIKAHNLNNPAELLNASHLSIQMNGIRRMWSNDASNVRLFNLAKEEGLLEPRLSEVDELMKMSKFSSGPIAGIEKALNSKFVELMSTPSIATEGLVRKAAFGTGVELAKRIYGNAASDRQVLIYARDYMKQALGNYSTAQRPMMFQGSLGAAMGLFQTYMLTYAQNAYRHLELKDYKGLGQTMLMQAGIFGAGSLPGFHAVSQVIGSEFSDEHFDLQSGTYRGLGDEVGSLLLYGLPSNLGPAVHTRGDVAPRIPTGFDTMVAPSMIGQALSAMMGVGKAVLQQDGNAGQAFFEALSTQSVSRPIARLSELASGYSVTGQGNMIAGNEEVWSFQGILARVLSTRPLNEAKARETIHLDSVYGAKDSEARQAVLQRLRSAIRANNISDALMDQLAVDYLRTGSPQGFRQAVNQAFLETSTNKMVDLQSRFGDSPLMLMVDDLD